MHLNKLLRASGIGALLATPALAQVAPILPYARTMDLLVCDSTYDGVWRLVDWNQDGDFHDPGEVRPYYDETIGAVQLGNPSCISTSFDGVAYVGDSTNDIVLALRDQNGDGDAHDAGEYTVFFDSATNASGIEMASVGGLYVDAQGRVFAAVANTGSSGTDMILLLEDLNGDGDANDVGEARAYHTVPNVPSVGDSIPTEVLAGFDLNLYYAEAGATGVVAKGVYRLADNNFDGDCEDAGERTQFWDTSLIGPTSPFHFGMAMDATGRFYLSDHSTNETIWTAFDANGDQVIGPGESSAFYTTAASTWWDIVVRDDGALLLCEDQTPDRMTLLQDLNGDGDAMDAGEAVEVYDDTISANPGLRPRAAAFLRAPALTLQPASVQIGNSTSLVATTSKPNELAALFLSTSLTSPVSLAPFGFAELDTGNFAPLGFGISDGSGVFSLAMPVPNSVNAIGTYGAQALCGDGFRLYLSNGALLTVTP